MEKAAVAAGTRGGCGPRQVTRRSVSQRKTVLTRWTDAGHDGTGPTGREGTDRERRDGGDMAGRDRTGRNGTDRERRDRLGEKEGRLGEKADWERRERLGGKGKTGREGKDWERRERLGGKGQGGHDKMRPNKTGSNKSARAE